MALWGERLSVDWRSGSDGLSHSICLALGDVDRVLEFCVWFDTFEIRHPDGTVLTIPEFIAGGRRFWDGLYAGDKRAQGYAIFTFPPPPDPPRGEGRG